MRNFKTGATRNDDSNELDYEGFISPIVLKRYAEYMHRHRVQSDGNIRASDNWTKGISKDVYAKSLTRHFMDFWLEHRGFESREGMNDALMGLLFNTMGYIFELNRNAKDKRQDN
jgi:hypothetical protein